MSTSDGTQPQLYDLPNRNPILEFPIRIREQSLELLRLTSQNLKLKKDIDELELLEMESIASLKKDGKPMFGNEQARKAAVFQSLQNSKKYLQAVNDLEDVECLAKKAQIELQYLRDSFAAHIAVGGIL